MRIEAAILDRDEGLRQIGGSSARRTAAPPVSPRLASSVPPRREWRYWAAVWGPRADRWRQFRGVEAMRPAPADWGPDGGDQAPIEHAPTSERRFRASGSRVRGLPGRVSPKVDRIDRNSVDWPERPADCGARAFRGALSCSRRNCAAVSWACFSAVATFLDVNRGGLRAGKGRPPSPLAVIAGICAPDRGLRFSCGRAKVSPPGAARHAGGLNKGGLDVPDESYPRTQRPAQVARPRASRRRAPQHDSDPVERAVARRRATRCSSRRPTSISR